MTGSEGTRFLSRATNGPARDALTRGDFSAAIALDPKCPGLYTLRATEHAEAGRWPEAIEDAHRAVSLHPENLDAFIRVYFAMEGLGRPDPSTEKAVLVQALERKLAVEPDCGWAYALKAEAEKRIGSFRHEESARDLQRAVALEPERAWLRAFLSRALTAFERSGPAAEAALAQVNAAVRLAPECGWMRAWRAQILENMGRESEALSDYDRAAALDPEYRLTLAWRGGLRLRLGDFAGAVSDLSGALEGRPDNAWTLHQRAQAHRGLRQWEPMLTDMRASVGLHTKYLLLHAGLDEATEQALLKRLEGRGGPAPAGLLTLEEANAAAKACGSAVALAWRGRVRLNLGAPAVAARDMDVALEREPGFSVARLWRGEARLVLGEIAAARADFERAAAEGVVLALAWRGAALAAEGDLPGAQDSLLIAARRDPADAPLYQAWATFLCRGAQGDVLAAGELALRADDARAGAGEAARAIAWRAQGEAAMDARRWDAAERAFTRALEIQPSDEAARRGRAKARRSAGDLDASLQDLDALVAAQPRDPRRLAERAEARRRLYDFDGGAADARAALELDASCVDALAALGENLRCAGDPARALEVLDRAVARAPQNPLVWVLRAKARRWAGDAARSLEDLERALALEPRHAKAQAWKGECLRKLGRKTEALAALDAALTADPNAAWVYALRAALRRETGDAAGAAADSAQAAVDARGSAFYDLLGAEPEAVRSDPALAWVYTWRDELSVEARQRLALAWVGRGMAHKDMGRLEDCVADFERARALAPHLFETVAGG